MIMGFSGIRIPGHSGSEFKHRTVFSKRKTAESSSSKSEVFALPITASTPTDYQKIYAQDRKVRLFFKLPVFLISVLIIGYVTLDSSSYFKDALNPRNHEQFNRINTVKETEIIHDYVFFINSGYYHLRNNDLYTAQREFTRALKLDEYNIDARIGLTKTMIERCKQFHEVCEEVQPHLNFLRKMKYLPNSGMKKLQEEFDKSYLIKKSL